MPSFDFSLSVVIPVFNEEKRLEKTFTNLNDFISNFYFSKLEIIFIDDGSTDNTVSIIKSYLNKKTTDSKNIWKLIESLPNKGKGWAVKQGMQIGVGDYILMVDADMSTPLSQISKFSQFLLNGAHVVTGSRRGLGANLIVAQPWYRRQMGNLYALVARFITGLDIWDFGCGFKVFSNQAARSIFAATKINGWIFDTEALFLAKKLGYKINTVGVDWTDDRDTRVKVFSSIFTSLIDLIKIRFFH